MQGRARFLVLLLAATLGAAPLAECLTAEPMTPAQMACCTSADHDCGAARVEDRCCRTGGRDGSSLPVSGSPAQPPPVYAPLSGWLLPSPAVPKLAAAFEAFNREILKLPERPTYLLVSVFLI